MNKEIFNQLSSDEQPVAAKLNSLSENMKVPPSFQWTLESQLMETYENKSKPAKRWFSKITSIAGWAALAIGGFILLNWGIRSLVPSEQITPGASNTEVSFETQVRQGDICAGPLALAHDFSVSLTNDDKTAFVLFDQEKPSSELRSVAWSADGKQLAILGNTTGSGNIHLAASPDYKIFNTIANPDFGYLHDFAWSRDGEQFVTWSARNNKIFLINADGSGFVQRPLKVQILGAPQFYPHGSGVVFFGGTSASAGLFELMPSDTEAILINPSVVGTSSYAFSPDGTHLAYMEYDRELGEARLYTEDLTTRELALLGTLPIPKGSGSSVPETANLSWSQDGTKLIFEFGRNAANRAVFLAYADGSGLVKIVDSAYAPTVSADGNCLAYISSRQVFIIDLAATSSTPLLVADFPTKGTGDFRLDKLQWSP
jgi:WD40 repeat protein